MNRSALLIPLLLVSSTAQRPTPGGKLDASRAFYVPEFADKGRALARTDLGPITGETYLRYLAARLGTRYAEDLAFDWLLARECESRRIGRTAPLLARALATRRLDESGRRDADEDTRCKFKNEALRELRIQLIVRADRKIDDATLRAHFDERYGKGGVRVRIRHVLVAVSDDRSHEAASKRARALHAKLASGTTFDALLPESDDRATLLALRDAAQRAAAGFVPRYNYERFGPAFAARVRRLAVGGVSEPVESNKGFHLIQLVERRVTAFADVAESLRTMLRRRRVSRAETRALRRSLLAKHRFRLRG